MGLNDCLAGFINIARAAFLFVFILRARMTHHHSCQSFVEIPRIIYGEVDYNLTRLVDIRQALFSFDQSQALGEAIGIVKLRRDSYFSVPSDKSPFLTYADRS